MDLDPYLALELTARLAAGGSLVAALELIAVRKEFGRSGVFSCDAVASLYWTPGSALRRIDRLILPILLIQVLSSAALVALGPFSLAGRLAATLSFASRGLGRWRRLLGGDGAEQLTSIALAATLLAVLPVPSPARVQLAVAFIGGQLVLSYVTAGVAKLASPMWLRGGSLPAILATEIHGHPTAVAAASRFPRAAALLGWTVVAFECLFPLLLLGPAWLVYGTLAVGVAFHLGCAAAMGLNSFLWAFPATYPCVLALRNWVLPFPG